jgi:hypothetical protein
MNATIVPGCLGSSCATRVSELIGAMGQFLSTSSAVRLGLAFFPAQDPNFTPNGCAPTRSIEAAFPPRTVPDSDVTALTSAAASINSRIQGLRDGGVTGGTPTAASLRFVGQAPGLFDVTDGRQDVIVLITDGLPNCNPANPQSCNANPRPPPEQCTLNPVPNPGMLNNCSGAYCAAGYLDAAGAVQDISALRARGILTLVIGLGTDLGTAQATNTLNAMAAAGGLPRRCPNGTSAECGSGDSCGSNRVCSRQFFAASNATDLGQVLAALPSLLQP